MFFRPNAELHFDTKVPLWAPWTAWNDTARGLRGSSACFLWFLFVIFHVNLTTRPLNEPSRPPPPTTLFPGVRSSPFPGRCSPVKGYIVRRCGVRWRCDLCAAGRVHTAGSLRLRLLGGCKLKRRGRTINHQYVVCNCLSNLTFSVNIKKMFMIKSHWALQIWLYFNNI